MGDGDGGTAGAVAVFQTWRQWIAVCDKQWSLTCVHRNWFTFCSRIVEDRCAGVRVGTRRCRQRADWWLLDLLVGVDAARARPPHHAGCQVVCLENTSGCSGMGHWTVPRRRSQLRPLKALPSVEPLKGHIVSRMASRQSSHHAHSKWTTHPPNERWAKCKFSKNKRRKSPKRELAWHRG